MESVRSNLMSIRKAAETFHVHNSTNCDKLTVRSEIYANIWQKPSLPNCAENKIGKMSSKLIQRTALLCKRLRVSTFKNGAPVWRLWNSFIKRHPELAIWKPEKLRYSWGRTLNHTVVEKYMTHFDQTFSEFKGPPHPEKNLQTSPFS